MQEFVQQEEQALEQEARDQLYLRRHPDRIPETFGCFLWSNVYSSCSFRKSAWCNVRFAECVRRQKSRAWHLLRH